MLCADSVGQFELIQKFEGHHGEVWALAVSHFGEFVVSGSHDKSIRVWEKTDEPVSAASMQSGRRLTSPCSSSSKKNGNGNSSKCTNPTLQIP
jgi:WD40 repeat protein